MKCSTELSLGPFACKENQDENEVLIVSRENSDENEVLDRIVPRGYLFLGRTRIRMKVLDRIVSRGLFRESSDENCSTE